MLGETLQRADRWLFQPGDARRLAALRIGLFAVLCARLCRGIYVQWARQPRALYRPVSLMRLFPLPAPGVVVVIQVLGVAACLLAVVGYRTRPSALIAWACSTILIGMVVGFGRDAENEAPLLLALVPVLASPSGDAWSLDSLLSRGDRSGRRLRSVRYGWPVRSAMVVVVGSYFFAGLAKVVWSGPAWITGSNLRWILYTASDAQRVPNGLGLFVADRPWLAHCVAAIALASEVLFPLVLWWPRLRWLFVPAVVLLHVGIWATIGLNYVAWATTTIIVFVDWVWVMDRWSRLAGRRAAVPIAQSRLI
jgi:hypothetical protein